MTRRPGSPDAGTRTAKGRGSDAFCEGYSSRTVNTLDASGGPPPWVYRQTRAWSGVVATA